MADVTFRRGDAASINATPISDGQLLWETTNNIIYLDNGSNRVIMAVGGSSGVRPIAYGGTGATSAGDIANTMKLDSFDTPTNTIPSGANLNSYTTPGVYSCADSTTAASLSGCPYTAGAFILLVRRVTGSTTIVQEIKGCCISAGTCNSYTRAYVGGTFGEWQAPNGTVPASNITGTISTNNLPTIPINKGGTGATSDTSARENIGIHYVSSLPGTYTPGHIYITPAT